MRGCTFSLLPRERRNEGHSCRKSTHASSSNFCLPLWFLGLMGTQAQAEVVLRLYLFESQISKEKCFDPVHLFEGQGWNRVLGNVNFTISLFDSQSPSIRLEAISCSSFSVHLSVWIPWLWEPQAVDVLFNPPYFTQIKAFLLATTMVSSKFLSWECQPVL